MEKQVIVTLIIASAIIPIRFFIKNHKPSLFHAKTSGALYDLGVNPIKLPKETARALRNLSEIAYKNDKRANPKHVAIQQLFKLYEKEDQLPESMFNEKNHTLHAIQIVEEWMQNQKIEYAFGLETNYALLSYAAKRDEKENSISSDYMIKVHMYLVQKIDLDLLCTIENDHEYDAALLNLYQVANRVGRPIEEIGDLALNYCLWYQNDRISALKAVQNFTSKLESIVEQTSAI